MKKINRAFLFILLTVIVLCTFGCSKKSKNNNEEDRGNYENTSLYMIESDLNNAKKQLHQYDSPYTVCFENDDGTYLFYVFSSPIQYKKNNSFEIINNAIISSDEKGYAFENSANNIKIYFPNRISDAFLIRNGGEYISFSPNFDVSDFSEGKVEIIQNMQGIKVQAVVYKSEKLDLCFYPTKAGIKLEIIIKAQLEEEQLDFLVESSADDFFDNKNGYVVLTKSGKNHAIIYSSLQKNSGAIESAICFRQMSEKDGAFHVYFSINNASEYGNETYPIRMDPSFELYQSKMPDTTVYSKYLTNSYLNNYAVLGETPMLGEGWHYIRVRLQFFMSLSPETIEKATFYSKCLLLSNSNNKIKILKNNEQWSSTRINWESRVCGSTLIGEYSVLGGYLEADITEFVKECFAEPSLTIESQGFMLKAGENQCIMATSENSMYTPYIKLVLNREPLYFEAKEDINQDMNY